MDDALTNLRKMERRWRKPHKIESEDESVFRLTVADHFANDATEIERLRAGLMAIRDKALSYGVVEACKNILAGKTWDGKETT